MMGRIVSDTGPLITLEKIPNGHGLVVKLVDEIIVPPAVVREVSEGFPTHSEYVKHFHLDGYIAVKFPKRSINPMLSALHQGEREAIALAGELGLDLLIEEKRGKRMANRLGIRAYGIAGLIYRAFKQEMISEEESLTVLKAMLGVNRLNRAVFNALVEAISLQ